MSRSGGYKCYNMSCNNCIGRTLCGEPGDGALNCVDRIFSHRTNADLVRAMNDDELAEWVITKSPSIGKNYTDSVLGLKEWLQQPAEED